MSIELLDEPTTALTVTARAALALSSDQTRKDLQALVAKSINIREVKNAAGRDEAHSAAMALVRARTTITKTGKAAREDAAAFQKAVIAEEKSLLAITEAEETRLLALRDAWDQARAAEKAEAERIERERVAKIHLRIADIREVGNLALQCHTSDAVQNLIERMGALTLDGYDEFSEEAQNVRTDALARMGEIYASKHAEEQERARIKAEQDAEAARLAAERAENARIAAEAKAEQDKRDADAKVLRDAEEKRLADERAEFHAMRARLLGELQAEADRIAAEAKALQTTVTEITPEEVAVTGPALLETDPIFNQEDGGELLDSLTHVEAPAPTFGDADVIACAATAVSQRFDISFNDALNRLAEIQEWVAVELAD